MNTRASRRFIALVLLVDPTAASEAPHGYTGFPARVNQRHKFAYFFTIAGL